jgi:hypothetical protein
MAGFSLFFPSFLYKEFGIVVTSNVFGEKKIVEQEPLEIEVYQNDEDKKGVNGVRLDY